LAIKNVRATYSPLGQERGSDKVLPGDVYFVAFAAEGLKVSDEGQVLYRMGMELTNREGKTVYQSPAQDLEYIATLGGTRIPLFSRADVGAQTPPGEYTMKVTFTDRAAKATQTLTRKFEVVKPQLGFVRIFLTDGAQEVPALAVPGQTLYLNFTTTGYRLDEKKQVPHVQVEMFVKDSDGKDTLPKPATGAVNELKEEVNKQFILWGLPLNINRSGKFRIVLRVTDKVANKTAEQNLDLNVVEVK
jgi:hypothetical protein